MQELTGNLEQFEDCIEIGVPLASAALLAGYQFDEIEILENDLEIQKRVAIANARSISKHLRNIDDHTENNPRMSLWFLERLFPEHFSQTNKVIAKDEIPRSVVLRGVSPGDRDE